MNPQLRAQFLNDWTTYFKQAALPLAYYYTDEPGFQVSEAADISCIIAQLARARAGEDLAISAEMKFCAGGKRYLGFSQSLRPQFEYFLSCGIPGKMQGERYKQTPELVLNQLEAHLPFVAPAKYLVFKRWDRLGDADEPLAVVFFAPPDVLSGLFTLANFDESDLQGVIAPFGAGCASIIQYPYEQSLSHTPRPVLGMFDVSARPGVPAGELTFTVPWAKFLRMVQNIPESFLITHAWQKVRDRLP